MLEFPQKDSVMGMLQEKVAIITGASSGIGRAAALLFAAEGASVILNARNTPGLRKVADTIRGRGGRAHIVVGDISYSETHDEITAEAVRVFGGLDIAFNNAAMVGPLKPLAEVALSDGARRLRPT